MAYASLTLPVQAGIAQWAPKEPNLRNVTQRMSGKAIAISIAGSSAGALLSLTRCTMRASQTLYSLHPPTSQAKAKASQNAFSEKNACRTAAGICAQQQRHEVRGLDCERLRPRRPRGFCWLTGRSAAGGGAAGGTRRPRLRP